MGDAKRRKEQGTPESKRIVSWLPLTTTQSEDFVRVSTQGAWIGIGLLVVDGAINWAEFWLVAARGLDRWRSLPLGNRSTVIRVAIAPDIASYSMS
jgi:Protein of unknown function (DUF2839)